MGKSNTWRDSAKAYIAEIIADHPEVTDKKELQKLFTKYYPFGERRYHPYKIWCDQVRITLGKKKQKVRGEITNPLQSELF